MFRKTPLPVPDRGRQTKRTGPGVRGTPGDAHRDLQGTDRTEDTPLSPLLGRDSHTPPGSRVIGSSVGSGTWPVRTVVEIPRTPEEHPRDDGVPRGPPVRSPERTRAREPTPVSEVRRGNTPQRPVTLPCRTRGWTQPGRTRRRGAREKSLGGRPRTRGGDPREDPSPTGQKTGGEKTGGLVTQGGRTYQGGREKTAPGTDPVTLLEGRVGPYGSGV